ncbi:MAG TPA: type II secretion system protein [Planctomycetota bacterium]|nr:type II secretion system protein [Planctomycetota bacterium]
MSREGFRRLSRREGFTLIEMLVVIAVIGIAAALTIPGLHSSRRASNERSASTTLKTLTSAEADFRANDRDWNQVNDFWTGDVKGLYTMTSARVRGARGDREDPPIRLIELSVAAADVDGSFVPAGGENMELRNFATPAPKEGYWFSAMEADHYLKAGDPDRLYRADTGGPIPMGKCHHRSKFGFIALPMSSWTGKYLYMINENNSVFRRSYTDEIWSSPGNPPGREGIPEEFRNWPDDDILRQFWCHAC